MPAAAGLHVPATAGLYVPAAAGLHISLPQQDSTNPQLCEYS